MEQIQAYLAEHDIGELALLWGGRVLVALAIFLVGRWVAKWITRKTCKVMEGREVDPTLVSFLGNILNAALLAAIIIASLDALGVPVTSLVAVLGAAGLAIGLAMKDSLSNFATGVMLILLRPFTKGDYVEVADVEGVVDEVRIFSTYLTTPDNKRVIVPNGMIGNDTITNYTAMGQRRVDLVFGVGYDDDLKVARDVLERICSEHPKVLDEPATAVWVRELGDSSVNFNVRPWVKTEDYWAVYGDLLETGKIELENAGCSIPYPQRDVHLFQQQAAANDAANNNG